MAATVALAGWLARRSVGGGTGGNGGDGGTASATVLGSVTYDGAGITGQIDGQGIIVQANGGLGGAGGGASGFTGEGGSGGACRCRRQCDAHPRQCDEHGHGADFGQFRAWRPGAKCRRRRRRGVAADSSSSGGAGAAGGNGGAAVISAPNASVIVTGTNSIALLAQSVGGGGGSGGDATGLAIGGGIAIGGNGGLGGDGGPVTLDLKKGVFASTSALGGAGLLAQSIGGSGGAGGSAALKGAGFLLLTIGGDAGGGGIGGTVNVTNRGDHQLWRPRGRGTGPIHRRRRREGGCGGFLQRRRVIPTVSVAVGGRGGDGGTGGDVFVTNNGQITTYGADAYGVNIHSIGGGGGNGGMAAARSVNISGDPEDSCHFPVGLGRRKGRLRQHGGHGRARQCGIDHHGGRWRDRGHGAIDRRRRRQRRGQHGSVLFGRSARRRRDFAYCGDRWRWGDGRDRRRRHHQ